VNLHFGSGVYFSLPGERLWLYEKHKSLFLETLEKSWAKLMAAADGAGVTVAVENCGDFSRGFVREGIEMLLSRHASLRLTWDTGHDAGAGYTDSEFVETHSARVAHMHLHDAAGAVSHLPLFTGQVDIEKALRFARERNARVVVEVKTAAALEKSVEELRERGLR
jgi:sugar phosphate isomerase/epimerase